MKREEIDKEYKVLVKKVNEQLSNVSAMMAKQKAVAEQVSPVTILAWVLDSPSDIMKSQASCTPGI